MDNLKQKRPSVKRPNPDERWGIFLRDLAGGVKHLGWVEHYASIPGSIRPLELHLDGGSVMEIVRLPLLPPLAAPERPTERQIPRPEAQDEITQVGGGVDGTVPMWLGPGGFHV
jgi:hypothetical protein